MNKSKFVKNGISSEREKLTSTKEGDDDEKSDDSDKQIVVVNRTIKSKIFLDSSKSEKGDRNCTSYARNAKGPVSKVAKKKNASPCGDAPLAQIIKRDNNNNKKKSNSNDNNQNNNNNKRGLQGDHSTATPKHQKFVHKSEQKKHIGGPPYGKRECADHGFFNELINSTCVNNAEAINDKLCGDLSVGASNEATHERDLYDWNKKKVGKIGKDIHLDKEYEEADLDYLPPYHERKYPLEEPSSHSAQNNKVGYPWEDNPPLRGANPSVHFALVGEEGEAEGEREEREKGEEGEAEDAEGAFTCHSNDEATSPVIKYDQFELYEIDREIEKITEEENNIQEKLIYLANQELDIVIKMKQMRAARLLSQTDGQPVEWDRGSHNADKG
ncbi:hypothetical protein PCYB_092080 [Plasmodium cynomolgi strain B]|uniref:Uncharacterized protein n=1 Tax=Plasmodium cynomolgi (strain B) TaxID=1120755 RepID=K6VB52_PLACD|nr:hypothetical protein PCYB_092080 [Plasmodium cynomolgi strain B]GAB66422.1 hypothetical protein PCYB_092080 [Plasmodium cynomolgi strain B]